MKKTVSRLLVVFVLCMCASVVSFAKETSRVITFGQDFVVGETSVKAGTYKITYNDKTNELTFADKKTKEVVAKVKATAEARDGKSALTDLKVISKGDKSILVAITFAGENENILIRESGSQTTTAN